VTFSGFDDYVIRHM